MGYIARVLEKKNDIFWGTGKTCVIVFETEWQFYFPIIIEFRYLLPEPGIHKKEILYLKFTDEFDNGWNTLHVNVSQIDLAKE